MLMGDMGADVIKIESPKRPDYIRNYPPFIHGRSAGYLAVNRAKKSLALDLQTPEGKAVFFDLVKTADLVVEGFRPGVLARAGLDYEQAKTVNPRIIYVSITGYGQNGPYAREAGHDLNYIGYAGILGATGKADSGPVPPAPQLADVAGGGYMSVIGALSALWARERNGKGQLVDVSMLDGVLPLLTLQLAHQGALDEPPQRGRLLLSGGTACYQTYCCADGRYVALGALESKFWHGFCEMAGHPEWIPRQFDLGQKKETLAREIADLFTTKTRDEWVVMGKERDICLTPVLALDELENDPQLKARRMIFRDKNGIHLGTPLKFSATPTTSGSAPAPELGEHGRVLLEELGYDETKIEALVTKGILL